MIIQLTTEKAVHLKTVCAELLQTTSPTIREVASVTGKIVFPGVMYVPLYYRNWEKDTPLALKKKKGFFILL